MGDLKIKQCDGNGQGSCKRCDDNGKWTSIWSCFYTRQKALKVPIVQIV